MANKISTFFLVFFLAQHALGKHKIDSLVPVYCWTDHDEKEVCLDDFSNHVRVLFFNAGWCSHCSTNMEELSRRAKDFVGEPVVFFSNSISGWSPKDEPASPEFLSSWAALHNAPLDFRIVASPISDLRNFAPNGGVRVPHFLILDKRRRLRFSQPGCHISEVFASIRRLLRES